ncbi:putative methyltransferase DDB_G0268948 [Diadema antillarum]|uniref:putative methyltransferase DDB_G0268948 n=1 Tax=Diadema antillarum TaxID=105358 RepID=UPI003A8B4BF7
MEATKLFEGVSRADVYAKYRPTWPAKVHERIMSFLSTRRSPPYKLAVDVGCGSGQSTFSLVPWFERVIGFDISEAQIGEAIKANSVKHVEFKVSAAEKLPLEDDSVDLLTCGLAAHWLEFDAFCSEVQRVLKPRGCLAIYGHGEPWLDHPDPDVKQKLTIAFKEFDVDSIGPFWHEKRQIACDLYRDFSLPFEDSLRFVDEATITGESWGNPVFDDKIRHQICNAREKLKLMEKS